MRKKNKYKVANNLDSIKDSGCLHVWTVLGEDRNRRLASFCLNCGSKCVFTPKQEKAWGKYEKQAGEEQKTTKEVSIKFIRLNKDLTEKLALFSEYILTILIINYK